MAFALPCHTERSEVSIKSKCILISMDISLSLNMTSSVDSSPAAQNDKAQNDNSGVDFSLVSLTQNDSSVDFHCGYALQVAWLPFIKGSK